MKRKLSLISSECILGVIIGFIIALDLFRPAVLTVKQQEIANQLRELEKGDIIHLKAAILEVQLVL